ncbi:uncharacterized protein LOC128350491 [Hemicordylus capensis]|uniref:uncharacterized protein LOC128350491 n=1 Tax=Hemicordylus capensis TaxID=884348 RepID=UPI0023040762|nr:uncharacterized protein LOC128350491 [Hemicordylus capensis]
MSRYDNGAQELKSCTQEKEDEEEEEVMEEGAVSTGPVGLGIPCEQPVVVPDDAAVPVEVQQGEWPSAAVEAPSVMQLVGQVPGTSAGGNAGHRDHAGSPVAAWRIAALQAIDASLAPSTRVSYRAKVGAFAAFRRREGLVEAWPVPVEHVMQFLVSLSGAGAGWAAAPVSVLLCGHSLVFWAYKRASASHFGTQLGHTVQRCFPP